MHRLRNLLLDRDGTVIREKPYLSNPEKVELLPQSASTLRSLTEQGFRLFLVTNQSGIGRGYFTAEEYYKVQKRLNSLLAEQGVHFASSLHCPHSPEEDCDCRKPRTGMWKQLQREFGLREEESIIIGDTLTDVEFGRKAGLRACVLVLTGFGTNQALEFGIPLPNYSWREINLASSSVCPDITARDLAGVHSWIMTRCG